MPAITANTSYTLNGVSPFTIGGIDHLWSNGFFGYVENYAFNSSPFTVNLALTGQNWSVSTLRFVGNLRPTITDASVGDNRAIGYLQLWNDGGSTVNLQRTSVDALSGGLGPDNVTLGSALYYNTIRTYGGNDIVRTGTSFVSTILSGVGNDTVSVGTGGAGSIRTEDGDDVVTAAGDVDNINLGDGANRLTMSGTASVGTVAAYGGADIVTLGAGGAVGVYLGDGNNKVITGAGFVAAIITYGGNDEVTLGSGGAGSINLGSGNDVYNLGANTAGAIIDGAGLDAVASTISRSIAGFMSIENLVLFGSAAVNGIGNTLANVLRGNNAANTLNGGAGNDTLIGNGGNDLLYGGTGNDVLTGGTGFDSFVFNAVPNALTNVDRIMDFNVVQDTVRIDNAVMPGLGATLGTLSAAKFWKSATGLAHDADDRIIYETDTGKLLYDANGNAAGGPVHFATIGRDLALTNADFVVI